MNRTQLSILLALGSLSFTLVSDVEAQFQRGTSNQLIYQRSLLDRINYLQRKNDELTQSLLQLQVYSEWILILEKRLSEYENYATQANYTINELQNQVRQNQVYAFQQEQEKNQFGNELTKFQQENQVLQKQLQESQSGFQRMEQALNDQAEKGQKTDNLIDQLHEELRKNELLIQQGNQSSKKNFDQITQLNNQLQAKTKKVKELYSEIDALNAKNSALNRAKNVSESSYQKALKERHDKEQATKKEADSAMMKLRKDYDEIKSQLNEANTANQKLRDQLKKQAK